MYAQETVFSMRASMAAAMKNGSAEVAPEQLEREQSTS